MRPKVRIVISVISGWVNFVEIFLEISELFTPVQHVDVIKDDPSDNRILEAAETAMADYIVSGDKHLLSLGTWNGIEILAPADFLERLNG